MADVDRPASPRKRTHAELRAVLAKWDRDLAALTPAEQNSYVDLATDADVRPMPEFDEDRAATMAPTPSRDADVSKDASSNLQVTQSVETSQQFFEWFGTIEEQMETEQESSFRRYNELLTKYSNLCADVITEIDNAESFLGSIETQYKSASSKTNALHNGCEELVREQSDLVAFNESISTRLGYFVELTTLSQKMNSPTLSVMNDKFIPMLARIDECITHVSANPEYKEAALYLARFKQCQNKAMALVKIHVVNTLRAATQHVVTQVQTTCDGADTSFTLFYGKFRMHAPRIKMLMQEIEKRAKTNADFSALLGDCYECYYEQRRALLFGMITKTIAEICTEHEKSLPALVRAGCSYISRMCANEYQLYQHFFHSVDQGLDFFLEGLANILYDACRPLFIHNVTTIDILVELCAVLRVETEDSTGPETAAFAAVAEQMLQDVQQRLCYITQNYVESHITAFSPSAADLDYPAKVKNRRASAVPAEAGPAANQDGDNPIAELIDPAWYPTVSRTIILLSKLYRSIDRHVFQGLSLEIVQACLASLDTAHGTVSTKAGKQQGRLFLIMHLIVIREQLAPFDDITFSRVEKHLDITGFLSSLKGATVDLIERRSSILSDATTTIFNFLQRTTPRVLEKKEDTAVDLEKKLKQCCLDYIADESRAAVSNLNSFNVMVDALPSEARAQLASHPAASPAKVKELVAASTKTMRNRIAALPVVAGEYLDKKTVDILVGQIRTNVLAAFKRFHDVVSTSYSQEHISEFNLPSLEDASTILLSPPSVESAPASSASHENVATTAVADSAARTTANAPTANASLSAPVQAAATVQANTTDNQAASPASTVPT